MDVATTASALAWQFANDATGIEVLVGQLHGRRRRKSPVSASSTRAATVPIIFSVAVDPVGAGLVASFARPGGRLTGVYYLAEELTAKRLEILHEIVPGRAAS